MRSLLLRRKKAWLLIGALAIMAIAGSIISTKVKPEEASASSTRTVWLWIGNWTPTHWTHYFSIDGQQAWCINDDVEAPGAPQTGQSRQASVYTLEDLKNFKDDNSLNGRIRRMFIAYYYTNEEKPDMISGWQTSVHFGLSYLNRGLGRPNGVADYAGSRAGEVYDNGFRSFPSDLESAEVVYIARNSYQGFFTAKYTKKHSETITLEKRWAEDDPWKDVTRPDSVTFNLYQDDKLYRSNIEVSAANGWKTSLEVESGHNYRAEETSSTIAKGYMPTVNGVIITNTLNTVNKKVEKTWSGTPASSAKICLNMRANGQYTETDNCVVLNSDNDWKGLFSNLPTYDKNGGQIEYSVREVEFDSSRYTPTYSTGDDGTFIVYNDEYAKLKVIKVWKDNNNALGARPASITVNILRDGQQFDQITLDSSNQVGDSNRWEKETPSYEVADDSHRYAYTISEDVSMDCSNLTGAQYDTCMEYEPTYTDVSGNGKQLTNSLKGTTNLYVLKRWEDESDMHNDRAARVYVDIYADGTLYDTKIICIRDCSDVDNGDDTIIDLAPADDLWSLLVEGMPKYNSDGKLIEYTVDERLNDEDQYRYTTDIEDVTGTDDEYDHQFVITNTREYSVSIKIKKQWIDNDNAYETRPMNGIVWFRVMRSFNGSEPEFVRYVSVSEARDWTGSVSGLPKYNQRASVEEMDIPYDYTVIEDDDEYAWNDFYKNNGCELTSSTGEDDNQTQYYYTCENELTGEVHLTGTKVWLDNDNAYGTRPAGWADFELKLYRRLDGESHYSDISDQVYGPSWTDWPVWIDDNSGKEYDHVWQYDYEFLPQYVDGKKAEYYVSEIMPPITENGYKYCSVTSPIEDDLPNSVDYANRLCGWVEFSGKKVWRYGTIPDDLKPEDITIYLYRDGEIIDQTTATSLGEVEGEDGIVWNFEFDKYYPKFDENGRLYEYSFDEEAIENFVTEWKDVDTVVNTYVADITVNKIWLNDDPSKRPGKIDVTLYRDDIPIDTVELNNDNNWSFTWDKLDSNYTYTVTEDIQIPGYEKGEYTYRYDDEGNLIIDIYNAKAPDTRDRGISKYVFMVSGVLLGGFAVSRRMIARR